MLLSLRKNGLTSLFKEVRAFKVLGLSRLCPKRLAKDNLQKNNTNKYYYNIWGFSICSVTLGSLSHGFVSHGFFARIFCTDFLHGFFARMICTDFLHGFSARIWCTDFLHVFLPDFFARISARIACKNCLYRCCTDFCTNFFGVSQNTCWEAPKFHRENPPINSPCFGGLLGRGSGGRRVRWDSGLTRPESPRTGGLGGRRRRK